MQSFDSNDVSDLIKLRQEISQACGFTITRTTDSPVPEWTKSHHILGHTETTISALSYSERVNGAPERYETVRNPFCGVIYFVRRTAKGRAQGNTYFIVFNRKLSSRPIFNERAKSITRNNVSINSAVKYTDYVQTADIIAAGYLNLATTRDVTNVIGHSITYYNDDLIVRSVQIADSSITMWTNARPQSLNLKTTSLNYDFAKELASNRVGKVMSAQINISKNDDYANPGMYICKRFSEDPHTMMIQYIVNKLEDDQKILISEPCRLIHRLLNTHSW
jgi:hypothetical protein